jgi:hypothetical protein
VHAPARAQITSIPAPPDAPPQEAVAVPPEPVVQTPEPENVAPRRVVVLRANAAVREVRVDGKPVEFTRRGREMTLTLAPEERAAHLEAIAADGRRSGTTVEADATAARIIFAPARAAAPPKTPPAPANDSDAPPPLAPIPYGQQPR